MDSIRLWERCEDALENISFPEEKPAAKKKITDDLLN